MGEENPSIKVGRVKPSKHRHAEIVYETENGTQEVLTGLHTTKDEPDVLRATRYIIDKETNETTVERGRIKGAITEAGHFVWEHKKGAAAVASVAVSVTLGSLWVRHHRRK